MKQQKRKTSRLKLYIFFGGIIMVSWDVIDALVEMLGIFIGDGGSVV